MKLALDPAELAFRDEAATWLHERVPSEVRPPTGATMAAFDRAWQREQFDGGWAGVSWPTEYGGRGLSLLQQLIWWEQYALARAPHVGTFWVALNHAGPTIAVNGTHQQREYHLPRILSGESMWCQGFSEPEAGSDLAGIRTTARVEGEQLVINGQKIWTSNAEHSDYQELLVRTERDPTSRHKGLTWLICDMRTQGIDPRPIRTAAGLANFCEVFYDDVRVPVENVVGGIGNGWLTAMSTLSFERGAGWVSEQITLSQFLDELVDWATTHSGRDGRRVIDNDEFALRIATARAELAALRATTYAATSRTERTGKPGPEGSMARLFFSELDQRIKRLAMDIVGLEGLRFIKPHLPGSWSGEYLHVPSATIGAGTSDIQRNIIAHRALGLPR